MRYIFLIVGIWNLTGAVNFLFFSAYQAQKYGYPMGNMWESHFIGGIAVVFALIYFSFFKKEPSRDMLYLVWFFAAGKIWIAISGVICYLNYNMPPAFAAVLGGGDGLMGILFILYIILYKRKHKAA
ncbi:MAG: hypothetical protein GY754_19130 [bacterium]|nr:hypothetical protein [bacterium]